jgi:pimeloyl-ACP methyl ester carboxylesterase
MEIKNIRAGEFEFDCRVCGDPQDELILFLHGFPETSYMWMDLMESLSARGFYCIAPDMRGYSRNACPGGVKHYTVKNIAQDILDIARVADKQRFHLIGHDWGAAVGWNIVFHNPNRILSWTALSAPHNRAFREAYKQDPEQKKMSRYIGWILVPVIPEILIRRNDFKKFRQLWKHSSPGELEQNLSVFRRKPTLTAALNYYRANIGRGKNQPLGDIETPTLFIWGKKDFAIGAFAAQGNHAYMKGDYTYLELDGGHWLMQTNYPEVETAVLEHVCKYKNQEAR